jgi:hypothetical protein
MLTARGCAAALLTIGATLIAAAPAAANSPPVTQADFYRLASDRHPALVIDPPGVLANDSDPDGDPLSVELLGGPTYGGTFHLAADGSFRYRPDPGFTGVDSIDYWAFDHQGPATIGHAYFTVVHRASPHDDAYGALTGVERRVSAPGVLGNDVGAERAQLVRAPRHGTVEVAPNGHFAYTSDPGFVGVDSFRYAALVGGEPPSRATVSLTVKADNARPRAVADDLTTGEDTPLDLAAPGVLANDTDPDGDPLTAEVLKEPFGEFFDISSDGSLQYWPPADYDSPVQFTYRVNDGIVWSKPVTSTIAITAIDDPPVAEDDDYGLAHQASLTVPAPGVLENDHDDVESDTLSAVLSTPPRKGTVDLHPDGSFTYERTPGRGGIDSFTYRVDDSGGAEGNTATVTIYPGFVRAAGR